MSPLVVIGLVLLAKPAAPSRAPVSLPMPPPPVVAKPRPQPADPPPPEAKAAPRAKESAPPQDRPLLSRIRLGAGVGPGFSLSSGVAGTGSPVWLRGVIRGTFDLLRIGPGDLLILLPVAIQSARFDNIVQGSVFGLDVMPSARYQGELFPDLTLFAELGLGFGSFQTTIQQQFLGYLTFGAGGAGIRVGAGLEYRLWDQLRILVQPMEVTSLTVTSTVTVGGNTVTTTATASQWSMIVGAVYPL